MKLITIAAASLTVFFSQVAIAQSQAGQDTGQDRMVQQQKQGQVDLAHRNDSAVASETAAINRQLTIARRTHNKKDLARAHQLVALRAAHVRAREHNETAQQIRLNHLKNAETQRDRLAHIDPSH